MEARLLQLSRGSCMHSSVRRRPPAGMLHAGAGEKHSKAVVGAIHAAWCPPNACANVGQGLSLPALLLLGRISS